MCNSSACAFQTRGPGRGFDARCGEHVQQQSFGVARSSEGIFLYPTCSLFHFSRRAFKPFCITHVGKMRGEQNNRTELEKQVPVVYVHRK